MLAFVFRSFFRFSSFEFLSYEAFALYKLDEKQDAPSERRGCSVSCILSLVLFPHADAVFVSATSFLVSMGPAFVFILLFLLLCHRQV